MDVMPLPRACCQGMVADASILGQLGQRCQYLKLNTLILQQQALMFRQFCPRTSGNCMLYYNIVLRMASDMYATAGACLQLGLSRGAP